MVASDAIGDAIKIKGTGKRDAAVVASRAEARHAHGVQGDDGVHRSNRYHRHRRDHGHHIGEKAPE